MSKKVGAMICLTALAGIGAFTQRALGGDEKTLKGEISDSQCALNVHSQTQSHKEMMEMSAEIKSEAECTRMCVKERGGRFVLQTKDKVYKLDAQALAEPLAGQKVKVVGTLDPKINTITVQKIEALPAGASGAPK